MKPIDGGAKVFSTDKNVFFGNFESQGTLFHFKFTIPYYAVSCDMRNSKWLGLIAALLLIAACFLPWVFIESKNITVTGVDGTGTNFGKPGYFHFILVAVFLVCTFTPRIWAKRLNLFISALNVGWAVKNFFMIAACSGGECPVRKSGIWLMLIAALLMLLSAFFPDMKVPVQKQNRR
jgi:hypothetical protein